MALDTFNPYLFVSAGEQSNKFLTPTYEDGVAQFQAQRAQELTGLTVQFGPIQEGTGEPALDNIRPISGRNGLTVTVQSGDTQNTYPISWQTEAGTVYGGTLDVVNGVLTVDKLYAEFAEDKYTLTYNSVYTSVYGYGNSELGELIKPNASTEVTKAICNMLPSIARNVASSTPGIFQYHGQNNQVRLTFPRESDYDAPSKIYALGVTAVIPLKEPLAVYQLTPEDVKTLTGFNQVYSDAGPVIDIKF